ncbi:SNF2-related protein [Fibrobacter sp.]|uniref:SNF2-related protein n=1 Tax=Fibrobacter sp. TaxID=35828 RepID=UPI00388E9813
MDYGVYGSTWWSKKWLDHLLAGTSGRDIDYAFKYVTRGQVQPFTVADNRVMASVKGPNGGLHNVYLVFPKFDKDRADVFVGLLKQQPVELAALSNGAINQSIELILSKCGLSLFDTLDRVNMNCDCKDALPCRYVISVFLKLAEMMSADPFVLFKIHGLDIAYLKDYKPEPVESDVPSESTLVRILPVNDRVASPRIPMFKFGEWRDYSHILPAMLSNFPEFCPAGNFKKSFVDELERCRAFYNHFEKFEQFAVDFGIYHAHTFLMEKERLQIVHGRGWQWTFNQLEDEREVATGLSVENVMGALCRLNQDCVWHNHVTVRFVHQLLQVAYYLVRCGAIYPQVFWLNNVTAQMRWLPAEMLPDVLSVVSDLEKSVPDDFAFTMRDQVREDLECAAEHILSVFIGKLLKFARTAQSYKKGPHENLLGFFFDCKSGRLAANGLKIPSKIQSWFSVYNSLEFNHKIIFHCSECGRDIAMDVLIETAAGREPLKALYENSDPRLLSLMNVLNCVAETFKPLNAYLKCRAAEPLVMQGAELKEFVTYSVKKFEVFGIVTEMPRSLKEMARPKQQMKLKGSLGIGAFTAGDLLDFDWEVALGDENVSAEEFLRLAKDAGGLLKYKDRYIEYTSDDLALLQQRLDEREKSKKGGTAETATDAAENAESAESGGEDLDEESAAENFIPSTAKLLQACLTGKCDDIPVDMTDGLKQQLDSWRGETEVALPENLNATLRPYQERGYSWMYKNLQMGFGCILADDMGLGKTLQVIAFLLKLKQDGRLNEGRALVVVPAGLLCNWQMEVKKFAPELSVFTYHGASRKLDKFNADLLITTYSTCRLDFKKLEKLNWQVVVIDEAQNIKNADSEQSRKIRAFRAPMKIAMSGTPVENRLMEFWTIMDFCNRGFLPSAAEFRDKYETPIQKNANQAVADRFKKITGPFMLRRMKTDKSIISDLPDKIQQNEYAALTRSQAALYKRTLDEFMKQLQLLEEGVSIDVSEDMLTIASDAMGGSAGAAGTAADRSSGTGDSHNLFKRKGLILQMILALKQICNHPRTYLKAGEANVEDSGKLGMLLDLLRSILDQGEKAIIFTQFREMGELLKETLARELEVDADFYHGGCTQNQRNEMVRKFQEDPETKVLILSLKAAGTGLNLTAASQVIHYDLWWNPAIEAQATDRAFRIGQTKNVQVHRFITKGTFEEKIDALLEAKKAVAQMTVNAGETWLADMDDKQLGEIFTLDSASAI